MAPIKGRLTALDVRAIISELRPKLVGLRLSNVYDVNLAQKMYLFKFARGDEKQYLLLESGVRVHTTRWKRTTNAIPSAFTAKLRRALRSRRLESISQVGADRVIRLSFGSPERRTYLYFELYVSGNVVLTDAENTILAVLREPVTLSTNAPQLLSSLHEVESRGSEVSLTPALRDAVADALGQALSQRRVAADARVEAVAAESGSKKTDRKGRTPPSKKEKPLTLRNALSFLLPFAHSQLLQEGMTEAMSLSKESWPSNYDQEIDLTELGHLDCLIVAAVHCLIVLASVSGPGDFLGESFSEKTLSKFKAKNLKGFAILEQKVLCPKTALVADTAEEVPEDCVLVNKEIDLFSDFSPLLLSPFVKAAGDKLVEFDTFAECVDTVFSNAEVVRFTKVEKEKEELGATKAARIQEDQQRRIEGMRGDQEIARKHAHLIEANLDLVRSIIQMVSAAAATGVSWTDLWNFIKQEQRKGHQLAGYIHALDLKNNLAYLLLGDPAIEDDEEDVPLTVVPVDIRFSEQANVGLLYDTTKAMEAKVLRTEAATATAVATVHLRKAKVTGAGAKHHQRRHKGDASGFTKYRKPLWFEKFNWFISSENFLVLAGREAQQNDLLYKRYFEKVRALARIGCFEQNDIYVHADVHGAASCIIKNPTDKPVPPHTLIEAGRMSVCRSAAWETKLLSSAWWVYKPQVSKSAPTGEYLTSGAFMIRGKKNFLPPWKLEMGLGILFLLGEDSVKGHLGERRPREAMIESTEFDPADSGRQYAAVFPSEELRRHVEAELMAEERQVEKEDQERQLRRLERQQQQARNKAAATMPEKVQRSPPPQPAPSEPAKQAHNIRGKRAKLKKFKKKYAEQDPEERRLRLALLGAKEMKGVVSPAPSDKAEPPSKSSSSSSSRRSSSSSSSSSSSNKGSNKGSVKEESDGEAKAVEDKEDEDSDAEVKEEEDWNELLRTKIREIDLLTATPLDGDTLLAAIPVTCPWLTLQSYKYKIKLLPGSMKKGKAGQQCLKLLTNQADKAVEKQLIQLIDPNILGHSLIGNVKVSAPGLVELQKSERVSRKAQQKSKAAALAALDAQ